MAYDRPYGFFEQGSRVAYAPPRAACRECVYTTSASTTIGRESPAPEESRFIGSAPSGDRHLATVLAFHSWLRQRLRYWRLGSSTCTGRPCQVHLHGTVAEGANESQNTGRETDACHTTACGRWRWFPHVSHQRLIKMRRINTPARKESGRKQPRHRTEASFQAPAG